MAVLAQHDLRELAQVHRTALAFSNKLPKIEHPECIFNGDKICRYVITWESSFSLLWKRIRSYMPLFFILSCILLHITYPQFQLTLLLSLGATIFLLLTLIGESMEKVILSFTKIE